MVGEDAEESGIDQETDGKWDDGWWLEVGRRKQVAAQSVEETKDGVTLSRALPILPLQIAPTKGLFALAPGNHCTASGIHIWLDRRMISFPDGQTFSILRGSVCGELLAFS